VGVKVSAGGRAATAVSAIDEKDSTSVAPALGKITGDVRRSVGPCSTGGQPQTAFPSDQPGGVPEPKASQASITEV
jgi:hypothetical protein